MINVKIDKFKDLVFVDRTHTYTVRNVPHTPATNVIKRFYEPFNVQGKSKKTAKKTGISQAEVIKEWERYGREKANAGTIVHKFAEDYVNYRYFGDNKVIPVSPKERAVVKYFEELHPKYIPMYPELKGYSAKYLFAGTIDIPLFNTELMGIKISDYKTNEKLYDDYGNYMLYPFHYMPETNFNKYQLQLSLYRLMLEEAGYEVVETSIIWLLSDGNYKELETSNFTKQLKDVL
jgi:hypothetical protein